MLMQIRARARELRHYLLPGSAFRRIVAQQVGSEPELRLLPILIDPKRSAIDVGANVGIYSLHLSKLVPFVHAFEPHPRMARILRANMPRNVKVHQIALSSTDGQAVLHLPVSAGFEEDVLGTIEPTNLAATASTSRKLEVNTAKLDSMDLGSVGFLKIDVEGHELEVLNGAASLLGRDKPTILIEAEERHRPGAVATVKKYLADYGYSGLFVSQGKTRLLDEPSLSGSKEDRHNEFVALNVNNFIFVPVFKQALLIEQLSHRVISGDFR